MFSSLIRNKKPKSLDNEYGQIFLDLVNGLRNIEERLELLERRFDALGTAAEPDEEALIETQLHVARLSAELSRLTVELRGKMSQLGNETKIELDHKDSPDLTGDESFVDLSADSPARASTDKRNSGWQPS